MTEMEYQQMRSFLRGLEKPEGQLTAMLADAIEQELTPRQRQLVRLYYLEQYNMKDIAAMLDLNPSTVSRTLALARRKLKKCLRYGGAGLLRDAAEELGGF